MAKLKFKTKDEAKEALKSSKEESKVAREELRTFEKENSLQKDEDHSKNAKFGKKWAKLKEMHTKKRAEVTELEKVVEEFKASTKVARVTTYDYPKNKDGKEMNAAEKKKHRASERARKKKELKGETKAEGKKEESKKEEKKKSSKKEEAKKEEPKKDEAKKGNGKKKEEKKED